MVKGGIFGPSILEVMGEFMNCKFSLLQCTFINIYLFILGMECYKLKKVASLPKYKKQNYQNVLIIKKRNFMKKGKVLRWQRAN